MNGGEPPTARYARTGEFTPPGMTRRARSKRSSERLNAITAYRSGERSAVGARPSAPAAREPIRRVDDQRHRDHRDPYGVPPFVAKAVDRGLVADGTHDAGQQRAQREGEEDDD